MPYITEESRNQIDDGVFPSNAGELNYMISSLLDEYLAEYGFNYANLNQVVGVLGCAKLEIYRRMAAPYEDKKMLEMGMCITKVMCIIMPKWHSHFLLDK